MSASGVCPLASICRRYYDNPACKFTDLPAVQRYLNGRNIEVVPGDIVETASRLADEDIVLSFIDTDNYSSARAALDIVRERTVVGGAIVFDHFTGVDRFGTRLENASPAASCLQTCVTFTCTAPGSLPATLMH
jgi:hypothetical protein